MHDGWVGGRSGWTQLWEQDGEERRKIKSCHGWKQTRRNIQTYKQEAVTQNQFSVIMENQAPATHQ